MATYPTANSASGLDDLIKHLRTRKFPTKLEAKTLQQLSIAPKNESYILNTLKFVGVIDREGIGIHGAKEFFVLPDDQFQPKFAQLVQKAYAALFSLHGDSAWSASVDTLIMFFRQEDQSTAITGKRQAVTFAKLAEIAGQRGSTSGNTQIKATVKATNGGPQSKSRRKASPETTSSQLSGVTDSKDATVPQNGTGLTLAVKIEMVLPTTDKKEIYDALFQSIKENLSNGT
jgi:hypothetical protein